MFPTLMLLSRNSWRGNPRVYKLPAAADGNLGMQVKISDDKICYEFGC
jgi:hypothetical protein